MNLSVQPSKTGGVIVCFFFNYNSINRSISIPSVQKHIDALFGKERADELRSLPTTLSSAERELSIIETISQALKEKAVSTFCHFVSKKKMENVQVTI